MLLKHRTGQGQWKSVDDNSLNKDQLTTKQNAHLDPQMDMNCCFRSRKSLCVRELSIYCVPLVIVVRQFVRWCREIKMCNCLVGHWVTLEAAKNASSGQHKCSNCESCLSLNTSSSFPTISHHPAGGIKHNTTLYWNCLELGLIYYSIIFSLLVVLKNVSGRRGCV